MKLKLFMLIFFIAPCVWAQPLIEVPYKSLSPFSPEKGETVNIPYKANRDLRLLRLRVEDFKGRIVQEKVITSPEHLRHGMNQIVWDGRDSKGEVFPPGEYKLDLVAIDLQGNTFDERVFVELIKTERGEETPPPLPYPKEPYRTSGRFGTFFRVARERGVERYYYEHIGELRVDYDMPIGEGYRWSGFALGSALYRRDDEKDVEWDSSAIRSLIQGDDWLEILSTYQDDIGSFDDPFETFTWFRFPRENVANRITLRKYGFTFDLIGAFAFQPESDYAAAARLTHEIFMENLRAGVSYVQYKAQGDKTRDTRNEVASLDLSYTPIKGLTFRGIQSITSDTLAPEVEDHQGYGTRIEGELNRDNIIAKDFINLKLGVQRLDQDFLARLANIPNQVETNSFGGDLNLTYNLLQAIGPVQRSGVNFRYFQDTAVKGKHHTRDVQGRLRLEFDKNITLTGGGQWRREDQREWREDGMPEFDRVNQGYFIMLEYRPWEQWTFSTEARHTRSDTFHSSQFRVGTSWKPDNSLLVDWFVSYIRTHTEGEDAANEFNTGISGTYGPIFAEADSFSVTTGIKTTLEGRHTDTCWHIRFNYTYLYLKRWKFNAFIGYGDASALNTMDQIETGLELQF